MKRPPRPRMLLMFLLLLLAWGVGGAIVNVAVAWGCIIACKSAGTPTRMSASEVTDVVPHWSTCSTTDATKWIGDRFAAHGLRVEYYYGGPAVTTPAQLLITSAGLPLNGVRGIMKNECGIRSTSAQFNGPRGVMIMKTAYPYGPIWPGFAINTVFYAVILWVLFATPFALRSWRRIRRGLCPKCAYPVGDSEVCTECGAPSAHAPHTRPNA